MPKKIGTDIVRKNMGEILDCVYLRGDEFIIERKHKPLAALVPVEKLEFLNKMAKNTVLEMISGPAAKESAKVIDRLANEAKHESRKKQ